MKYLSILLFAALLITTGCGKGLTEVTIYSKTPIPGGTLSIWIDGDLVGTLIKHHTEEPECGASGTITRTVEPGKHSFRSENSTGIVDTWQGEVKKGKCLVTYVQ